MYANPKRRPWQTLAAADRNAFGYARVSSKDQAEGFSTAAQRKLILEYADRKGLNVLRTFEDIETARETGREQFQHMLEAIEHGECRRILVEKTDRLYRNLYDAAIIEMLGIEIHLVKESEIVSPDASSHAKLVHGFKLLMARNYSQNLSEEARKGMRQKADEGLWPSYAPLGYMNAEADGKRIIVPDPETAPLVRQMFEWYGTGRYGLRDVARMARAAGLAGRRTRATVPTATVHRVLQNGLYAGNFVWLGERHEGKHEPLISVDLFNRVQELMRRHDNSGKTRLEFSYSGLVKCGHCGCALVGEIKKGRYRYYHCTGWRGRCAEPYLREEALTEHFKAALSDIAIDAEVSGWIAEALRDSAKMERQARDEAQAHLQSEHERLQARLDAAYEDRLDGRITAAMFDEKAAGWRTRQDELARLIAANHSADRSFVDEGVRLLDLLKRTPELFEKGDAGSKRQILRFVISNSAWAGGKLSVQYREPFSYLADAVRAQRNTPSPLRSKVAKLANWRGGRDSNPRPPT